MGDRKLISGFTSWRDLVDDPLTKTVMRADGVDREALIEFLTAVALPSTPDEGGEKPRVQHCDARGSGSDGAA